MSRAESQTVAIRALTMFSTVPTGCRSMPVLDEDSAPHLKSGEVAILDPGDVDLQHGELYAIAYGRGPSIVQAVWRTTGNLTAWWAMALDRPRGPNGFNDWVKAGRIIPMADGPYRPGGLEERILGRVVGILQPAAPQVAHV